MTLNHQTLWMLATGLMACLVACEPSQLQAGALLSSGPPGTSLPGLTSDHNGNQDDEPSYALGFKIQRTGAGEAKHLSRNGAVYEKHIPHCWETRDVTEYDVKLSLAAQPVADARVRVWAGEDRVLFEHLRYGMLYRLDVDAIGNHAGNPHAPVIVLNSMRPATASVLFSGFNDVDNLQTVRLEVPLDCGHLDPQGLGEKLWAQATPSHSLSAQNVF